MDLLKQLIDVFLHIDKHLAEIMRDYGAWTNTILFVDRLLRDRPRRDAVPSRRFAPLHGRGARRARQR